MFDTVQTNGCEIGTPSMVRGPCSLDVPFALYAPSDVTLRRKGLYLDCPGVEGTPTLP